MKDLVEIIGIYEDSFRANIFTREPFRMIGLIDVEIRYNYVVERVTLAYYRSSGTNSGKINGLWYPIVGIKEFAGEFREFTGYLNLILTKITKDGSADEGWLIKSLFFSGNRHGVQLRGFSYGVHQEKLFIIGKKLSDLYEYDKYTLLEEMDARYINFILTSKKKLYHNLHTQRENYERFIYDVYKGM